MDTTLKFYFIYLFIFAGIQNRNYIKMGNMVLNNNKTSESILQIVCDQHGPPGKTRRPLPPSPPPPKYLEIVKKS